MLRLTSIVTDKPVYFDNSSIIAMEVCEAYMADGKTLIGIATILYVGGATWYVKETPTEIMKLREIYTQKTVNKIRKLRKDIDREDWEEGEGD